VTGFLLFASSYAQTTHKVHYQLSDKPAAFAKDSLKLNTDFEDPQLALLYINRLPNLLHTKGYIAASIDSVHTDTAATYLNLYIGERYVWNKFYTDSIDKKILDAVGYQEQLFEKNFVNFTAIKQLQEGILNYLDNNGYPFATLKLVNIKEGADGLEAQMSLQKGPLYKIDSIRNMGTAVINPKFLQRYLGIMNGSYFKKSTLMKVSRRIDELPFLQEQQPWSLTRLGTGSILNLYLAPRKSSQINVLVGLLPATEAANNIYEAPRTKMQFTGEATVNLKNALGGGETIGLNWQQLQLKSPRLNLLFQYPYLAGSAFGITSSFDLFKKDSSFININMQLGTTYDINLNQTGTLFIQSQQSNLLTVDTNVVKATKTLPQELDLRIISFGFKYDGYTTNYRYNPTSGNEWTGTITVGTKTIKKNNVILSLTDNADPTYKFDRLYDTFQLKSYQFRVKAQGAHYFKLTPVSTIKAGASIGWIESASIFRNELFQIGGYKLLRGFDEESIYASRYAVFTAEYRYLIGRNSYLFSFVDAALTQNAADGAKRNNQFIGAGAGLSLETKAGMFNISFAAGKRNDLDFSLRQSKIHLGYVNFF